MVNVVQFIIYCHQFQTNHLLRVPQSPMIQSQPTTYNHKQPHTITNNHTQTVTTTRTED